MLSIAFPMISPIAIDIGIIQIRWYSLAYIFGAILAILYIKYLCKKFNLISNVQRKTFFDDVLFYCLAGILLGGRLGYVIFYNFPYYFANPIKIFYLWEGGMAFHGGLIGVIIACYLIGKKYKKTLLEITDIIAPAMPIGLFLGRIANFINAELYGKASTLPWAVVFPNVVMARHPSQLYEAFLEGIVLFVALYVASIRKYHDYIGRISGYTLLLYGIFRFTVEFVRQGEIYFFNIISMGQVLSIPLIIFGAYMIRQSYINKPHEHKTLAKKHKKAN